MLKHIYQIIKVAIKSKTLIETKLKISQEYTSFLCKTEEQTFEEWEKDYFLTVYLSQMEDDPFVILSNYCNMFFEKNKFNVMSVSNKILYDHKYYLAVCKKKDYIILLKFIQTQNLAALDAVNVRAKKVIQNVSTEIKMLESFTKDFAEGNFQ